MKLTNFICVAIGLVIGSLISVTPSRAADTRQVYVVPFSHLDFFWGGTREECLARGNRIISRAIDLSKRYPEFRFLIEDNDFVANFMESRAGLPEAADLKRLVKSGQIEIAPKWVAAFQDLQDGEILARNLTYGQRYARSEFGVMPKTAHLGDIPGFTPQYPQILQKANVPYMVMTRMGPSDKSLFFWRAPDQSKVLTWFTLKGYGWGSHLGLQEDIDSARRSVIEKELAEVGATTNAPIFMNWGTDLWAPNEKLAQNLSVLNRDIPGAHFQFSTPDNYFESVAKLQGIPEVAGEIPSSWPNVVASLPHLWPLVIPATNTLLAAERFATINHALHYGQYPQSTFDFLWKKLIESTDHNHDGQGGWEGDERKRSYSELSILRGGEILRDSLRNIAERVKVPIKPSFPLVVFNPMGWKRDDVVNAHVTIYGDVVPGRIADYRKGMRLVDETGKSIPFRVEQYSENMSRALKIVFVAQDVPSLGYKTFYLTPSETADTFPNTATVSLDDVNDSKEPRRPLGFDEVENDYYKVSIDRATGRVTLFDKSLQRNVFQNMEIVGNEERGGNYIGIEPLSGRTFQASVDSIKVEENNDVRTVISIKQTLIDMPVVQRLTLYKALKRLDIENTIEWTQPRLVRMEQLFPYASHSARIQYGVPYGVNAADNLIPGSGPHLRDEITKESWLQSRHIQNWLSVEDSGSMAAISTDAVFVRLSDGAVRGQMLRGARYTSVKVVRDNLVTSMDYPPAGSYTFKYSITSGTGDWKTNRSYRTGLNFNNPLLPVSVVDELSEKILPPTNSFFSVEADDVVLSALKKADDGDGIVARLYETTGQPAATSFTFLGQARRSREVNLLEEGAQPVSSSPNASFKPFEIKTVFLQTK
jgi:alpha-mannosidase